MVGHTGSTTRTVHADVTMTRSKVKVMGLLNFRQIAKPCMLAAMTVSPLEGLSGFISFQFSFCTVFSSFQFQFSSQVRIHKLNVGVIMSLIQVFQFLLSSFDHSAIINLRHRDHAHNSDDCMSARAYDH